MLLFYSIFFINISLYRFTESVDLRRADLDCIVRFFNAAVELYPTASTTPMPPPGQGLNSPALVFILYKFAPQKFQFIVFIVDLLEILLAALAQQRRRCVCTVRTTTPIDLSRKWRRIHFLWSNQWRLDLPHHRMVILAGKSSGGGGFCFRLFLFCFVCAVLRFPIQTLLCSRKKSKKQKQKTNHIISNKNKKQ